MLEDTSRIIPISDIRHHQNELLADLSNGPVVIASRSKPVAVMIAPKQWDAMREEVHEMREVVHSYRLMAMARRVDREDAWVPWEQVKSEIDNRSAQ